MKNSRLSIASIFFFFVCLESQVLASVIDFETLPNGNISSDDTVLDLNDAYVMDGIGVTFGFDTNNDQIIDTEGILEEVGNDTIDGFFNDSLLQLDTAATGFETQLGNFFLRQPVSLNNFGTFIIDFESTTPLTAASGEIWDVDGNSLNTEQYQVDAFNSSNILLDTIISPIGNDLTLDGKPWTFDFSALSDIEQIWITFIGTRTTSVGLAFNNFFVKTDVTSVPEPSTMIGLGLLATLGIGTRLKRKKK